MKSFRFLLGLFVFFVFQKTSLYSMDYSGSYSAPVKTHTATVKTLPRVEDLGCYRTIQELLRNPSQENFDLKKGIVVNGCQTIIGLIKRKLSSKQTSADERLQLQDIHAKLSTKLQELKSLHPLDADLDRLADLLGAINL